MSRKWFKMMIPLLLLMMLAAPLMAQAESSVRAEVPFTVDYAPGTVVMEALDGAPEPTPDRFAGKAEGSFAIEFTKPGNYAYTLYQLPGADQNVVYDETVFEVEVTVMVNEDGSLYTTVTVSLEDNAHKPEKITLVNVRKTGSLRVAKEVKGNAGDQTREWHFTISLSEALTGLYDDVWFDRGVAHITLKHGETLTVQGLPAGVSYEVTEDEANENGYVTTASGTQGVFADGVTSDVSFVNEKNRGASGSSGGIASLIPPKTGDDSNLILWLGLGAISLLAIAVILLKVRKR